MKKLHYIVSLITEMNSNVNENFWSLPLLNIELVKASKDGDLQAVEELLERGANINTIIDRRDLFSGLVTSWTPLHYAARGGHFNIVKCLVEKGANIEAKDSHKHTPLFCALFEPYTEIIEYLIDKGANIEAENADDLTPLNFRMQFNNTQPGILKYLIQKGAYVSLKTLQKYPYLLDLIHEIIQEDDFWSSFSLFMLKEMHHYEKEELKQYIEKILENNKQEIPENVYILLNLFI